MRMICCAADAELVVRGAQLHKALDDLIEDACERSGESLDKSMRLVAPEGPHAATVTALGELWERGYAKMTEAMMREIVAHLEGMPQAHQDHVT